MKADPKAQQLLLELQGIDTARQQLAHRRSHLPEHAQLQEQASQVSTSERAETRARTEVEDLDRDIARQERDVEQVQARKERDSARLVAGTGPARELTALQHEIESLERRQRELEDTQLELMERREEAQRILGEVRGQLAERQGVLAETQQRRDAALAEIAEQEAAHGQAREPLLEQLPAELVRLYERLRDESGGLGAALLRGGRCGGCRLDLSGSERARVRAAAPDELVRCEECRRIMVRTAESGL